MTDNDDIYIVKHFLYGKDIFSFEHTYDILTINQLKYILFLLDQTELDLSANNNLLLKNVILNKDLRAVKLLLQDHKIISLEKKSHDCIKLLINSYSHSNSNSYLDSYSEKNILVYLLKNINYDNLNDLYEYQKNIINEIKNEYVNYYATINNKILITDLQKNIKEYLFSKKKSKRSKKQRNIRF